MMEGGKPSAGMHWPRVQSLTARSWERRKEAG